MIRAPRITPLARPTSEPTPERDHPGQEAAGDRRGRILGGRPSRVQGALVDAQCAGRVVERGVDRGADLIHLSRHTADGGHHGAGGHRQQPENHQPGREAGFHPVPLQHPGEGLKITASTAANVSGRTISLTAASAATTIPVATTKGPCRSCMKSRSPARSGR